MAKIKVGPTSEEGDGMRRRPQQQRSRATLTIIKQAALEILSREGVVGCTTHRIAERSGLSIGSLYKYFSNREAILRALYEDASIEYAEMVGKLTLQILDLPTEAGMELTIRSVISLQQKNRLVLIRMASDAPELRLEAQPTAFQNLVRANIRAYVQHRNPLLKRSEFDHRCFFIERTVFSCIQGYIVEAPENLSAAKFARDLAGQLSYVIDKSP